jgi:hypothetical protein
MRFVPIKTDEQLDMQSLHRVRERWIMRRTSVVNQIRGLLLERASQCGLEDAIWMRPSLISWKMARRRYQGRFAFCWLN